MPIVTLGGLLEFPELDTLCLPLEGSVVVGGEKVEGLGAFYLNEVTSVRIMNPAGGRLIWRFLEVRCGGKRSCHFPQ